ncbi:response regulator [Pedobacter sp. JY14-1]|uniref:response regulator n=1 Tax=Pedobacter sp. JY14-1 TaxID=3034151 RepID=UPI0023E0D6F3|nr:response regulator [Pedobacter sp. JY14-1]
MFEKVLIAEDHESVNRSVRSTLEDLKIENKEYVYYCDDALNYVQKAVKSSRPYELLITDLYFDEDHHIQVIKSGIELIDAALTVQPDLKVIVFSAENRISFIKTLFEKHRIHGYICKGRNDAKELKAAIAAIFVGKTYISAQQRQNLRASNHYNFDVVDLAIVSLLTSGVMQKEIPSHLQQRNLKPSSLSSVEKKLNAMRDALNFSNNEQLIAYCKDYNII